MSQSRLGIASVILVALAGVTLWRINARKAEDTKAPAVKVEIGKIDTDKLDDLELQAPDKPKVKLVKKDDAWRLVEPVDAAADDNAIRTALTKLAELEVTGVAATKSKNHAQLEVDGKESVRITAKSSGKVVLDAWVGAYRSGNTMVRLEGQEPVASVRGSIRFAFNKDVKDWRNRTINETKPEEAQRMLFDNEQGKLEFKLEGDEWKQVVAKGQKPIDPLDVNKVKGVLGTASSLTATDFAPPEMTPEQAGIGAGTMTVELQGEGEPESVVLRVGNKVGESYYVMKEGNPIIYVVSAWTGGRLLSNVESLTKQAKEPTAPTAQGGLPDEIMKQLPSNMQMIPQMPAGHP
jgi:hypothetical protein